MIRAQIKKLNAALELNKIWYDLTEVKAFSDGYITNLTVTPGGYYRPGEVLCGFVDCSQWYVQANLKESELSAIQPGVKEQINHIGHIFGKPLFRQSAQFHRGNPRQIPGYKITALRTTVLIEHIHGAEGIAANPCGYIEHLSITPSALFQKMLRTVFSSTPRSSRRCASLG